MAGKAGKRSSKLRNNSAKAPKKAAATAIVPDAGEELEVERIGTFSAQIAVVPIEQLLPDEEQVREHNPRNVGSIQEAIERHGTGRSVVIDEDLRILAGNGTIQAAMDAGVRHVVIIPNDGRTLVAVQRDGMTPAQKFDLAVSDNRTAELATGWKVEELKAGLERHAIAPATYFYAGELEELSAAGGRYTNPQEHDGPEGPDPADSIPDKPAAGRTQDGDLWTLGDHRLLCGDSFEDANLDRLTGGKPFDMVLTDPPYAIYGSSSGISSSIADDKMVRPFFEALGKLLHRATKKFGHVYVHCDWRSWATLWEGMKRADLTPKNCLVWDKNGSGLGTSYAMTYELIGFFARLPKQTTMQGGGETGQRGVLRPNVLRFNRPTGDERLHNAAKPVALLEELIENSSDEGETVFDPFSGSGSTMIAAQRKGRRALCIEVDPGMCDVIVARWEAMTGDKAELAERPS